jgi:hypothetical protein
MMSRAVYLVEGCPTARSTNEEIRSRTTPPEIPRWLR